MISLDQVILLEQKIESAVEKIQQLQAENDALRKKCSELTNALSSKTEQLSTFENDQTRIESGIRKALDRLSYLENSVLKASSTLKTTVGNGGQISPIHDNMQATTTAAPAESLNNTSSIQSAPSFHDMKPVQSEALPSADEESEEITISTQSDDMLFETIHDEQEQDQNDFNQDEGFSESYDESEEENEENHTDLGFDIF